MLNGERQFIEAYANEPYILNIMMRQGGEKRGQKMKIDNNTSLHRSELTEASLMGSSSECLSSTLIF